MDTKVVKVPEWTLGDRLAKARKVSGMTQEEMADELDVSHSTVAKWEIDRGQPRNMLKRLEQWADLTAVPLWWLLGVDGDVIGRSSHLGFDLPEQLGLLADAA